MAKGIDAHRIPMVRGLRQEELLPRSRPKRILKMVAISNMAPSMSIRGNCFFHGVSDGCFGRLRKKPTIRTATRQMTTWMRKALIFALV